MGPKAKRGFVREIPLSKWSDAISSLCKYVQDVDSVTFRLETSRKVMSSQRFDIAALFFSTVSDILCLYVGLLIVYY